MASLSDLAGLTPHELGETGDPAAVPFLIEHMGSPRASDRKLAASAIKKLTSKHGAACSAAVPHLMRLTGDDAPQVRQYAVNALTALKPSLSAMDVQRLQAVRTNDPKDYNRKAAAAVLQASGYPASGAGKNKTTETPAAAPAAAPLAGALAERLARHYLACIEAEDRRSLQLPRESLGGRFISPVHGPEVLLTEGAASVELSGLSGQERSFLEKEAMNADGPDAGLYGYPLWFAPGWQGGWISPLFLLPVTIEDLGGQESKAGYRLHRSGPPQLNRTLFRGFSDEELDRIQDELEDEGVGTFGARVQAALETLESGAFDAEDAQTEPFPKGGGGRWARTPVLFHDARGPYTVQLRRDLDAIARYDSVQKGASKTALAALWGAGGLKGAGGEAAELRPLNASQRAAVRSALEAPLTAITGPPGTGKSQVAVDLLATAILEGRPVLFASKNNQAVDVVRQRLREALGEPFDFTVRVGSRKVMAEMEPEVLDRLARLREGPRPTGEAEARSDLDRLRAELEVLVARRNALAAAEAAQVVAAAEVPSDWQEWSDDGASVDAAALRALGDDARAYAGRASLGLVRWARRLLFGSGVRRGLVDRLDVVLAGAPGVRESAVGEVADGDLGAIADVVERVERYGRWLAAQSATATADRELRSVLRRAGTPDEEEAAVRGEAADATARLCRAVGGGRLWDAADDVRAALQAYRLASAGLKGTGKAYAKALGELAEAYRQLARHLPVWITTALSVRNALPLRAGIVDLVVIDEASQCDVASAVPLLYRARRAAVIGDPNQLRHIAGIREEAEAALPTSSGLLPDWSYVERSLFDRASAALGEGSGAAVLLDEHYRSVGPIIGFSNARFYGGALTVRTDEGGMRDRLPLVSPGVHWHHVPGAVPPGSRAAHNPAELEAAGALLEGWLEAGWFEPGGPTVGVVTPFRAQKERLQRRVRRAPGTQMSRTPSASGRPTPSRATSGT